jgi:hypothetical protein
MLSGGKVNLTAKSIVLRFRMDCRVKPGNDDMKKRSRDAMHPSFAKRQAKKRCSPSA